MKSLLALAALCAFSTGAFANAAVGRPAPPFAATDLEGKPVNLADYKGRTVVLEWHNFACPFVQKHYRSGNMQALQKKYGRDVVWLAVNSTHRSAYDYAEPASIAAQLRDSGAAPARYVMDDSGQVGRAYGAKVTPHMYIIDAGGTVVYNGAIDDQRSADLADVKIAKNYVAAALDEIKSGRPVTTPATTPYGCSVHYK
jgi:peroxiredoxin